jgi:hypothetical protein
VGIRRPGLVGVEGSELSLLFARWIAWVSMIESRTPKLRWNATVGLSSAGSIPLFLCCGDIDGVRRVWMMEGRVGFTEDQVP